MRVSETELDGLNIIEPNKIGDDRGWFIEAFRQDWFSANVADVEFVQDNQSMSSQVGTIRGLHYQKAPMGQGKLVRVVKGTIFDVAVDIRPESDTFGKWVGIELSAQNQKQLWVPDGFAHGFCTLEPNTEVFYKVTAPYCAESDAGIAFDDPEIGIDWPVDKNLAILSQKDMKQPSLDSLRK